MPTYHYQCKGCLDQFTVTRSIKDPILTKCEECGADSLETVLYAVEVIDGTPRTLGAQADKNFSRAGQFEREARHQQIEAARQRAVMEKERMPEGAESIRKPVPDSPWWRPGTKQINPKLVSADPKTKQRYIDEGKV